VETVKYYMNKYFAFQSSSQHPHGFIWSQKHLRLFKTIYPLFCYYLATKKTVIQARKSHIISLTKSNTRIPPTRNHSEYSRTPERYKRGTDLKGRVPQLDIS
jgi:hypothetical protein